MSAWYDILLLLLLLIGITVGFAIGMVRQLINIGALLFGLFFASYYHPVIMRWVREQLGVTNTAGREAALFFVVFALIWLFVNLGAFIGFRHRPRFLPETLDRLAGMVLGIFTGVFAGVIITLLLGYATSVPWPENDSVRSFIADGINASVLRGTLMTIIPAITGLFEPWLPRGLPSFFVTRP